MINKFKQKINYKAFKGLVRVVRSDKRILFKGMCPIVGTDYYIIEKEEYVYGVVPSVNRVVNDYLRVIAPRILDYYFFYNIKNKIGLKTVFKKVEGIEKTFFVSVNNGEIVKFPEITTEVLIELRKVEFNNRWL